MKIIFTRSFEKSLAKTHEKERVKQAVGLFIESFETQVKPHGLGLKKLAGSIWEIRAGLRIRVLFSLTSGELRFLLAGDHSQVKDFLKTK